MEHLSKQQIVLLTLLVSFVTSIATGIVTVSLLDQAPSGVTQTINRVVEKTIERVSDSANNSTNNSKSAAIIGIEDQTALAVETVSKSIVRIKPAFSKEDSINGFGLIVSKDGVIVTDKKVLVPSGNLVAIFSNGQEFPIQIVQSQINGDIVFAVAIIPADKEASIIVPISFISSLKLGQTVLSFSDKSLNALSQGIIQKVEGNTETSIESSQSILGSPVFTTSGQVIGFKTSSLLKGNSFYPLSELKSIIPVISHSAH